MRFSTKKGSMKGSPGLSQVKKKKVATPQKKTPSKMVSSLTFNLWFAAILQISTNNNYQLQGLGNFASDSTQNPGFSSCCNHNYKPLGHT